MPLTVHGTLVAPSQCPIKDRRRSTSVLPLALPPLGWPAQGKVSAGAGFSGSAVTVTGGVSAKTLTATTCTCQQRSNLTDFGGRQ